MSHIRDNYASVFVFDDRDSAQRCMQRVFSTPHQTQLAYCVAAMDVYRPHLLGKLALKGNLFGVRPIQQPDGYVAVMPYPACLHRATSSSLPTQLLRLGARHSDTLAVAAGALIAAVLWVLVCVLAYQMIGLMC
jgi:hypothetical protein